MRADVAAKIAAITLGMIMAAATAAGSANAAPPPSPMIECPDHSHVWNQNQCPTPDAGSPFGFPGNGHGGHSGGLLGILGGIL